MSLVADLDYTELQRLTVVAAEDLSPELWLSRVTPAHVGATGEESVVEAEALFGEHHREFWTWLWSIEPEVRPDPYVAIWPRGGAKSTSAELAAAALGCRRKRTYGLYVCRTQSQADDHVGNVASILEGQGVATFYPLMAERLVGKYGSSKGWRRNRIRTASGFTIDAIGLDTAARGVKLDEQRPDFMVFDDLDHHDDSPQATKALIDTLTKALIPAGSSDLAIIAIQNLVHRDGVFARMADGRAKFLARRIVSGPKPALVGLVTEHQVQPDGSGRDVIVAGDPTWQGQTVQHCQEQIDDMGLTAFLAEVQHDVARREGALWVPEQMAMVRVPADTIVPDLVRLVVAVDPSGGSGDQHDAQGIVVAGKADGRAWVVEDATVRLSPAGWGDRAVQALAEWDADAFVVEVNFGGDMCVDVLRSALERYFEELLGPGKGKVRTEETRTLGAGQGKTVTLGFDNGRRVEIRVISASRGKRARAEPVAALYGRPDDPATWSTSRVHHLHHFPELEEEMTSWSQDATWSPNRLDAMVWAVTDLLLDAPMRSRRRGIVASGGVR